MAGNLELIHRFYEEILVGGNLDLIDELVDDDLIDHQEEVPGQPSGKAAIFEFVKAFRRAFPDLEATVGVGLEDGDLAAAQTTMTGTHRGELLGVAPTERTVTIEAIDIVRVRDGKVVEHWDLTDTMGLMQQLGAIPEAAA